MAKFDYKDGCLLCNQCGRLYEQPGPQKEELVECPCGNSENLDTLGQLIEIYNPPRQAKPEAREPK